ncbi:HNH endonuclease [Microvirga massiliensis]|uniref:HNH endonuclease n=1 Tax=Microvirga massiliensis TaxID=1033741 RepID=UPI0009E3AB7D|nr:HNH endonuclease [Microvirga massiliensis]
MTVHVQPAVRPDACPALVLNADYRPLSYYPLSVWCWQDAIKAVFLDRVNIVSEYDRTVRSPSFEMRLPSVVSLKTYVKPTRHPAFTRFNVFLRDCFTCQYCGAREDLTFDHVIPRSKGGQTTWTNLCRARAILLKRFQCFTKHIYRQALYSSIVKPATLLRLHYSHVRAGV